MMRPRGQGLLGGALGVTVALLVGACGDASDEAAPTPEPTVEIADAPAATAVPAEEPTATAAPTATEAPAPTAAPERSVEEQVIAAWERYLDLSIQARSGAQVDYSTFIAGDARAGLETVVAEGAAAGEVIRGRAESLSPTIEVESDVSVLVTDCAEVNLERVLVGSGETVSSQQAVRSTTARLELIDGAWLVTGVDSGEAVGCGA